MGIPSSVAATSTNPVASKVSSAVIAAAATSAVITSFPARQVCKVTAWSAGSVSENAPVASVIARERCVSPASA